MQIGEKIKHLRQSNKMSQSDLAKSLHVSYQAISNGERNKSYPDKENIIMISNLFNVPLDELMRDEQKYTPRSNSLPKYNLQNIVILRLYTIYSIFYLIEAILSRLSDHWHPLQHLDSTMKHAHWYFFLSN